MITMCVRQVNKCLQNKLIEMLSYTLHAHLKVHNVSESLCNAPDQSGLTMRQATNIIIINLFNYNVVHCPRKEILMLLQ